MEADQIQRIDLDLSDNYIIPTVWNERYMLCLQAELKRTKKTFALLRIVIPRRTQLASLILHLIILVDVDTNARQSHTHSIIIEIRGIEKYRALYSKCRLFQSRWHKIFLHKST